MLHKRLLSLVLVVPFTAVLWSAEGTVARAQFSENNKAWPLSQRAYYGYKESPHAAKPVNPGAEPVAPKKYRLALTIVPAPADMADSLANAAYMMAHVPENAKVRFMGVDTTSTGTMREFRSPRLEPGSNYVYTVRVDWVEEGQKVTQEYEFNVKLGAVHCIYLVQAFTTDAQALVKENLSKLGAEDRKLAEAQSFCAVQPDNRLGIMGVPVKVMVKGNPVFLCCEGCSRKALKEAEKTLEKVKELKEKGADK